MKIGTGFMPVIANSSLLPMQYSGLYISMLHAGLALIKRDQRQLHCDQRMCAAQYDINTMCTKALNFTDLSCMVKHMQPADHTEPGSHVKEHKTNRFKEITTARQNELT